MCTKVTWSTVKGEAMDGSCWLSSDDAGGEEENMEAFLLEVASDLIGSTEQTRGVRVVNLLVPTDEEGEEEE
jgi:hypothetical protein